MNFKNLLVTGIIIFIAGFSTLNAQVMIGPYIGANLSTVTGDNSSGNTYRPGLNIGLAIDVGLTKNFLIETGLGYDMKGSGFDNTAQSTVLGVTYSSENSGHTTFSYLSIPVLAMVKAGNFFFQAGPEFSALVAQSSKYTTTTTTIAGKSTTVDTSSSSTSGFNTIDYGLNLGIGFQATQGAFIRLGSVIDFGDINKASTNNLNTHNLLFQLSVGWKFGNEKGSND